MLLSKRSKRFACKKSQNPPSLDCNSLKSFQEINQNVYRQVYAFSKVLRFLIYTLFNMLGFQILEKGRYFQRGDRLSCWSFHQTEVNCYKCLNLCQLAFFNSGRFLFYLSYYSKSGSRWEQRRVSIWKQLLWTCIAIISTLLCHICGVKLIRAGIEILISVGTAQMKRRKCLWETTNDELWALSNFWNGF